MNIVPFCFWVGWAFWAFLKILKFYFKYTEVCLASFLLLRMFFHFLVGKKINNEPYLIDSHSFLLIFMAAHQAGLKTQKINQRNLSDDIAAMLMIVYIFAFKYTFWGQTCMSKDGLPMCFVKLVTFLFCFLFIKMLRFSEEID